MMMMERNGMEVFMLILLLMMKIKNPIIHTFVFFYNIHHTRFNNNVSLFNFGPLFRRRSSSSLV